MRLVRLVHASENGPWAGFEPASIALTELLLNGTLYFQVTLRKALETAAASITAFWR